MESLRFQIEEISRAQLKPGEDEALEAQGGSSFKMQRSSLTAWMRLWRDFMGMRTRMVLPLY